MNAITRREACCLLCCIPPFAIAPLLGIREARAEEATAAALAAAEEQYAAVQVRIDELAAEHEALSFELAATLDAMEAKRGEIEATQTLIEATEAELQNCQSQLAEYIRTAYKNGATSELEVLLASADYEELFRNMYYLTKVSDSVTELIEHTREVARQLEEQKALLEEQHTQLDTLREQQEWQLGQIEFSQAQTYDLLYSLDAEVQALTEQYNQELLAQAQAAAEAEAAAAAGGAIYGSASASAVVNACYSTPSPGAGYCAAWVTNVLINAGVGAFYGDACDMYASRCYTSDRSAQQPGMIIAVSTHPGTAAGRIYGHVGIYIGGGTVMDNIGYIRTIDVDSWISSYNGSVTPRWGWLGGIALA